MSKEQANAFRKFVNKNEAVQEQIKAAASDESFSLVALAAEHGYELTPDDAESVWLAAQDGELPALQLGRLHHGLTILAISTPPA